MTKRSWALTLMGLALGTGACSSDAAPTPLSISSAGAETGGRAASGGSLGNGGASSASVAGSAGMDVSDGGGVPNAAGGTSGIGPGGSSGSAGVPAGGGGGGGGGGRGVGGSGGGSTTALPTGSSTGCKVLPPASDSATGFIKHDVEVTEVMDSAVLAANAVPADKTYNWQHRNYFVRLPKNYDNKKPYLLSIGGSGCGGSETVGSEGGYALLGGDQTQEVQVALSYVTATSACFTDDYVNSPDLQYFDAMLADVEAHYCIDKSKVFVHGYSSGAWETYLLGCARAGIVRGIFTSQGGERLKRPACTGPIAALLSAGADASNDNPIGPLDPNSSTAKSLDSLGSAVARDEILKRNGCTSTMTKTWSGSAACQQYVDCPSAYPVIWCPLNGGHDYASSLAGPAEVLFQSLLPGG